MHILTYHINYQPSNIVYSWQYVRQDGHLGRESAVHGLGARIPLQPGAARQGSEWYTQQTQTETVLWGWCHPRDHQYHVRQNNWDLNLIFRLSLRDIGYRNE